MHFIPHENAIQENEYMELAADQARKATCTDARCGAVIVKDGEVIGKGFNSPAWNLESERRCHIKKTEYHFRVTDKTCCVHAEQRAIMDALKHHPEKLAGSTLFYVRVDENGDKKFARGFPFCTLCSKMTVDAGISEFVWYQADGLRFFGSEEYNALSFSYSEE